MLKEILLQKGLSRREAEVAVLVSKGLRNKEVADQLFIEEKTVKFHLTNVYKKMKIKARAQLIVWCMPHISFEEQRRGSERLEFDGDEAGFSMPIGRVRNAGNA